MSKKDETLLAEFLLIKKAMKNCLRYALEIDISGGRVDFITSELNYRNMSLPEFTCYEIKVSANDFKSRHGHNLDGDYNYYVVSKEVLNHIKSDKHLNERFFGNATNRFEHQGLILIGNSGLKVLKKAIRNDYTKLSFEQRLRLLDKMLISWTTGSMFKYLKRQGIDLRNEESEGE